jgi:hypothetical protein
VEAASRGFDVGFDVGFGVANQDLRFLDLRSHFGCHL